MVIKLLGSVLVIGASFSVGYYMSKSLGRRRKFLNSFIVFLNSLAINIKYNSEDIYTLVARCADSKELQSLCIKLDYSKSFYSLWQGGVLTIPKAYSLNKKDIELLMEFGSQLGKTDVDGQLKHIELYKIMFLKQLADAEEQVSQKSRLYKTMGFFIGTAAALIMI